MTDCLSKRKCRRPHQSGFSRSRQFFTREGLFQQDAQEEYEPEQQYLAPSSPVTQPVAVCSALTVRSSHPKAEIVEHRIAERSLLNQRTATFVATLICVSGITLTLQGTLDNLSEQLISDQLFILSRKLLKIKERGSAS